MKLPKLLVIGGAGYIGSVLAGRALTAGHSVRVLDNLTFGGESLLPWMSHPAFEFCKGDLRNRDDVIAALDGVEAVVLLAAIVGDPACAAEPDLARAVNRDGARQAYDLACEEKVGRFVMASTCSNYGRMDDPDGLVDEDSPLRPVSLYAELKVELEKYLLSHSTPTTTPIVLRFATAYGLSPRPRFDLTVNEFSKELALGRSLEIFGEQFWRPYAHVDDLSRACLEVIAADHDLVAGQAFNVGRTDENYQKGTLVTMILEQLPEAEALVSYVQRDEDPRDYRVRFDKIENTLGWRTEHTVAGGIKEIIRAVRLGVVGDPNSPAYRNVPTAAAVRKEQD
jgi:nucleoside-diphosphate-sugar epimerase